MLLNQTIELDRENKAVRLRNTIDVSAAQSMAKEISGAGGGRFGQGSSEMRVMGYIPPEMWLYDPWLLAAKRARNEGDMGEYTKMVRKFFEVHPSFAVITPRKYF